MKEQYLHTPTRGNVFGVLSFLIIVLIVTEGILYAVENNCGQEIAPGWEQSYKAGYLDSKGHYAGGSEIMHLVGHQGKLYAAAGYWEDSRNIWYGGKDPNTGWGQILRLDKPGGRWEVDLEMGPQHLRPEILKSVTFTTDGKGKALKESVNLLIANAFSPRQGSTEVNFFVRDDKSGKWEKSTLVSSTGESGENNSVRNIRVYRDKVTGIERIFISIGLKGIYSGVYDSEAPGKIRWDKKSESGPVEIRPLAVIEANHSLLFSSGKLVYRRKDGERPTYNVVHDLSDVFPGKVFQPVGGIRGMTAIPNPKGEGESLLFVFCEGNRTRGCVYRLDPDGEGGYTRTQETCLDSLMSDYLSGNPVYYLLAAYNDIFPVLDPSNKETVRLIGFESWVGGNRYPIRRTNADGGFYTGAMYAIRDRNGKYRLSEVNGPSNGCKRDLVAPRTFALSPFNQDNQNFIYIGGFDGNDRISPDTAWVFRTSLENALRKDVTGPMR